MDKITAKKYCAIYLRTKNSRIRMKQFKKLCGIWGYDYARLTKVKSP